jgi:hypothetical protein
MQLKSLILDAVYKYNAPSGAIVEISNKQLTRLLQDF